MFLIFRLVRLARGRFQVQFHKLMLCCFGASFHRFVAGCFEQSRRPFSSLKERSMLLCEVKVLENSFIACGQYSKCELKIFYLYSVLLSSISGLGPKKIAALKESGINTLFDLLSYLPRDWIDQRRITKIKDIKAGERVVLVGHIVRSAMIYKGRARFSATLQDDTGSIEFVFFGAPHHWQARLKNGSRWVAIGKGTVFRTMQMVHPDLQALEEDEEFSGNILPIYTITESMREARMESKFLAKLYKGLFEKNLNLILPPEEHICPTGAFEFLKNATTLREF